MSTSLLIVGGRNESKPGPDLLVIGPEKDSITIDQVRRLERFLQRKPLVESVKTAVIGQAEKLTLPAQHALLKTLEEPPPHSQIILYCQNENRLLPTIISRCLVERRAPAAQLAGKLKPPAPADAVNKETALAFVADQLNSAQNQLRQDPARSSTKLVRALLTAERALNANVNPKLTLDVLSLSY